MQRKSIADKVGILSDKFSYVGVFVLFMLMLLTTADVIGRYVFKRPIVGTYELTEYMVLITIFAFFPYAQSRNAHIDVDLLFKRFPKRVQSVVAIVNHLICLFLMVLITWMGVKKAIQLREAGQASTNLAIPAFPFVLFLALGCGILCLEYVRNIIGFIKNFDSGLQ